MHTSYSSPPAKTPLAKTISLTLGLLALSVCAASGAQVRPPATPLPAGTSDPAVPRVAPAPARPSREANAPSEAAGARTRSPIATSGRTLRLAPTGRWWDNESYTRTLAINASQQRRMDTVFGANRDQLTRLYNNLKEQEARLDKLGKTASEPELDQQIDKISQARTELQKADTHLLLEIRKQLTPEQLSKLDAIPQ